MNWAAISFDWNHIRAFLATAEEGSLSAAARVLKQSQPTVGRQVAALEAELDVTLFERVGRSLELTAAGVELLEHVREMGAAATRISMTASGQSQAVDGHVRVTASDVVSVYSLPPVLARLRAAAPGITVEVVAANSIRDLLRREADIAIRHVRPEQPDLIARKIGETGASLYAAPALLDRLGRPGSPEDLAGLPFVGFDDTERLIAELGAVGVPLRSDQIVAQSENGVVAWSMVMQGIGVGIMADSVAAATGGVERILPVWGPVHFPVWLCVHRELRTSRRIRLVFDFLAEELSGAL